MSEPLGALPRMRLQMVGGMPVARMAVCVLGGSGHLLLSTHVSAWSMSVLKEQTQLFRAAVVDHTMRVLSP